MKLFMVISVQRVNCKAIFCSSTQYKYHQFHYENFFLSLSKENFSFPLSLLCVSLKSNSWLPWVNCDKWHTHNSHRKTEDISIMCTATHLSPWSLKFCRFHFSVTTRTFIYRLNHNLNLLKFTFLFPDR